MKIENINNFRMPRYNELPNMGLYIEQVLSYIEEMFEPLEMSAVSTPLTSSMVNNYVKQIKKIFYLCDVLLR